jgi:ribosomal protein S18 acetylase RimI-like enzyme
MQIRDLELNDLNVLVPLFDAYRVFYRKKSDPTAAHDFLLDRMTKGEAIFFGAFLENELAGFTTLYPLFSSVRLAPIFLLNDLFVLPQFRNRAIGKGLLTKTQDYAIETGQGGILLETEKTNDIGNNLYPRMGFHREEASNFYFWDSGANL